MGRKCVACVAVAALLLVMGAGVASAKAVKQIVACTPEGVAKVTLNYCPDELQVMVNVNASGLAPGTTYTVAVLDEAGAQAAAEDFTTKPDNSQGKDNGKGKANKKKNFKSKGHVNIHVPWADPLNPPDLTLWSVTITAVAAEE